MLVSILAHPCRDEHHFLVIGHVPGQMPVLKFQDHIVGNLSAHLFAVHADFPGIRHTALGNLSVMLRTVSLSLVDVGRCVTKSIVKRVKGPCSKEHTVVVLEERILV